MGIETLDIVDKWLYELIAADPLIRGVVGNRFGTQLGLADSSTNVDIDTSGYAPPYLVWNMDSSRDITGNNGERIYVSALYTVKIVSMSSSWNESREAANHLDSLLHRAFVSTDEGDLSCVRERIRQYVELPSSLLATRSGQFRHLGGTYRFQINSRD